jgi:hypothetical protein
MASSAILLKNKIEVMCSNNREYNWSQNFVTITNAIYISNHYFKVSLSNLTNSTPYHYTSASKSDGFLCTTISETLPRTTINTHSSVATFQIKLGFIRKQNVLPSVSPSQKMCMCPLKSSNPVSTF